MNLQPDMGLMQVNIFAGGTRFASGGSARETKEAIMAQKGAGGNPGSVPKKGGDDASGSTGTGRGGGKAGGGQTGKGK